MMHLRRQLLLRPLLVLPQLLLLAFADLLDQVGGSRLVLVHEMVPLRTELLEFATLGLLSCLQLAVVEQAQVLVASLQFTLANLLDLALGVAGLGVAAVTLALLAVVI
jgi:hypothetical protein